jgi:hypothetical protein
VHQIVTDADLGAAIAALGELRAGGHAGSSVPGPVGATSLVLLLSQQFARAGFQKQLHERRVHSVLLLTC